MYSLHSGAKDNFVIGPKTGIISVAAGSNLDIQANGAAYNIKVRAEDIGEPFHRYEYRKTDKENYTRYISVNNINNSVNVISDLVKQP